MSTINDNSSLLEIMFAVNSVFLFLINSNTNNKQKIYEFVYKELKKKGIDSIKRNDTKSLKKVSYKMFGKFKMINDYFFRTCLFLALLGVSISLLILILPNISPEFVEINTTIFLILVILFIIITPTLHILYHKSTTYLAEHICQNVIIDEHWTKIFELMVDIDKSMKEMDKDIEETRVFISEQKRDDRRERLKYLITLQSLKDWRLKRKLDKILNKKP